MAGLSGAIGAATGGSAVGSAVVRLLLDTSQYEAGLAKAKATTTSAASGMSGAAKAATNGFIALGVGAVAAIAVAVRATTSLASEVRTLQRVTGESAESASGLISAAAAMGIGVDQLATGFGILAKNINSGAPAMVKWGIVTHDAAGETLPFDTILTNTINKFQTLPENSDRAAFAMQVFGRSGKALIPILSKGVEGIEELKQRAEEMGLIMSQEDVDAAKALSIAQNELGEATKGLAISVGTELVPVVTVLVNGITAAVKVFALIPGPVKAGVLIFTALTGALLLLQKAQLVVTAAWSPFITALGLGTAAEEGAAAGAVQLTLALEGEATAATAASAATTGFLAKLALLAKGGATGIGLATPFNVVKPLSPDEQIGLPKGNPDDLLKRFDFTVPKEEADALAEAFNLNADAARAAQEQGISYAEALAQVEAAAATAAAGVDGLAFALDDAAATAQALRQSVSEAGAPLQELGVITGQTAESFAQDFTSAQEAAAEAAAKLGLPVDETRDRLRAFGEVAVAAMDDARQAIADFAEGAKDSLLGFTNDALSTLADKTHLTVDGVISSFDKAAAATRRFGRDVLEISRTGGQAGKDLAEQLLSMGPAAAGLAAFIANASGKAQRSMIEAFGAGGTAAERAAGKISHVIVGTLRTVQTLLEAIAKKWGIEIDLPGAGKSKQEVAALHSDLVTLAKPYLASVSITGGAAADIQNITNALHAIPENTNATVTTHYVQVHDRP